MARRSWREADAPSTLRRVNDELAVEAAAQGGAVTRVQALAAGYTPGQIRGLIRSDWLAPYRGVYVERRLFQAADADGQHVLRAAARLLTSSLGFAASHETGALVHALPFLGKAPKTPQVTRAPRFPRDRSESRTVRVAPLPDRDLAIVAGVRVTSGARTACDIARTRGVRAGVVVADSVLRRGTSHRNLLATAQRCGSWPGGGMALQVAAFADGRADGPLESITRVAYELEGLPRPETQVEVRAPDGTFLGWVDFLWRDQRVIGEADGLGKYETLLALQKEKLREEALRAYGFEVVRNVWDDVWTERARAALARRIRQAFAFTADRPAVPGVLLRTPSLQELLFAEHSRAA